MSPQHKKKEAILSCIKKGLSSPRGPSPEHRIQSTQCTCWGMLGDLRGGQQERSHPRAQRKIKESVRCYACQELHGISKAHLYLSVTGDSPFCVNPLPRMTSKDDIWTLPSLNKTRTQHMTLTDHINQKNSTHQLESQHRNEQYWSDLSLLGQERRY